MYQTLVQSAKRAIELMNGKPELWPAIATHFAQEKGWHWWENPQPPYNVGNVKVYEGKELVFGEFDSLEAGIEAYAHFLTHDPAGYYADVVRQLEMGTVEGVLKALSDSPYCAPPYPLHELEAVLGWLETHVNGDTGALHTPTPQPTPTPSGEKFVTVAPWPSAHGTLWGIAHEVYGDGNEWRRLLSLNPGINPQALHVGQKIRYA